MKRKIAAILAADIAGYSKLVAEDEEETLRRLGSYRAVFDDFIKRHDGRIFNTAGDAVLAEFASAVDAVRCAIDVQESLRTRNLAYPASRQMEYRIGISIGDIVERDGDLLGDGVNIAARLEGLAEAGGICVSRAVHEQVANKLSVPFADIGEQMLKNIPTPVHAFRVAMHAEKPGGAKVAAPAQAVPGPAARGSAPTIIAAGCAALAAIAASAFIWSRQAASPVAIAPSPATAPAAVATAPLAPPSPTRPPLIIDQIPYLSSAQQRNVQNDYVPAKDNKALAISWIRYGVSSGQDNEETAKSAAMEACNAATKSVRPEFNCELYAVGMSVVSARGRLPMPPGP